MAAIPRSTNYYLILLYLVFSPCVTPLLADEQNVAPGINRYYEDTDYQRWLGVFEQPGREVYAKRHVVVATLNLEPGIVVADIGAGTGFYIFLFAEQVTPSGKVYAVDIADEFIKNIQRRAKQLGLHNIQGILSIRHDTRLPANSIDLAFVCDTYHHFEYPLSMLASIRHALRAHGQLVIIDFRKQHGMSSDWIMSHVRANKQTVINEVEKAGFKLRAESDVLQSNYFLKFIKN